MEVITIKDIAKVLNLSTSTVSRALRGSYEINAETKRLVMEYAERMNYRPNPIALSLKENRSRSIGIIIPEIANNFFSFSVIYAGSRTCKFYGSFRKTKSKYFTKP